MYLMYILRNISAAKDLKKIFPAANSADVGHQASFTCESDDVKWYYEKIQYLPISTPISFHNKYQMYNVKNGNSGNYFCYGKYRENSKHFLAKATLTVYGKTYTPVV